MTKHLLIANKRIRIGNQSACSAADLMEPFAYAVLNGFDAFEWFPDKKASGEGWTIDEIGEEARAHIRATADKHDISLSVHIPWQADPLHPGAEKTLLSHAEFARDLGASRLILHLYLEKGIRAYLKAITPLILEAGKRRLRLALENTPETSPEAINALFAEIRRSADLPAGHVGLCLDIGHANLCGATLNQYIVFVDRLDPRVPILHLHLHENYGNADSHLPLFTGPAGVDDSGIRGLCRRLLERAFCGNMILEQWPYPPMLLNQARNRLIEIFKTSETGSTAA